MTFGKAQEIRSLVEAGSRTKKSIAEEFGISPQTLQAIVKGRTWKPENHMESGSH